MQMLFPLQIETGRKCVEALRTPCWAILKAQMQSGKTGTFLFAAFEILNLGYKDQVFIFSGNSETALRNQILDDLEKFAKFHPNGAEIKSRIHIVWGSTQIKNLFVPTDSSCRTLIIWDESHFAQSIGQMPHLFFEKFGISANGEKSTLEEKQISVLSVSATPFSEYSDIIHLHQSKQIIYLPVDDHYLSVEKLFTAGNIRSFTDWRAKLIELLNGYKAITEILVDKSGFTHKYGIVRLSNEAMLKEAEGISAMYGWDTKIITGEVQEINEDLHDLLHQPEKNTIILIKGMFCMGKQVCTTHVLFGLEAAEHSKTDTFMQRLLGRFCGYNKNTKILVYLHESIIRSGEIIRYIEFAKQETPQVMPIQGMNLEEHAHNKRLPYDPIIPIHISRKHFALDGSDDCASNRNESIRSAILDERCSNLNSEYVKRKIFAKLENAEIKFRYHNIENATLTKTRILEKICKSIHERVPSGLGSSGGCRNPTPNYDEVQVFVVNRSRFDVSTNIKVNAGDVFVFMKINKGPENMLHSHHITRTTRQEIFHPSVGAFPKRTTNPDVGHISTLPEKAGVDIEVMEKALCEYIDLYIWSIQSPDSVNKYSRSIGLLPNSRYSARGIIVSNEVLQAIEKGGCIYKSIRNKYRDCEHDVICLKVEKRRGKRPIKLSNDGFWVLKSISW